jgi:exosortase/archaeosortase family protein
LSQALTRTASSQSFNLAAAIGRRELLLWIVVCLLVNQSLLLLDVGSLQAFAVSLLAQNDVYWFACGVTIYRLYLGEPTVRAGQIDCILAVVLAVLILLSSFLPHQFAVGLLMTAVAFYLLMSSRGDRNLRAAGGVLLAMSAQLVWGLIIFRLFTPELLEIDATLVGTALKALRPDIVWNGTTFFGPDGHSISLIAGCSSFNNVSTSVLACTAVVMLKRTGWIRRDVATILIAGTAMILINCARICLLAWSSDYHSFWHDGGGVQVLAVVQTVVVFAVAWWGTTIPGRGS